MNDSYDFWKTRSDLDDSYQDTETQPVPTPEEEMIDALDAILNQGPEHLV